MTQQQRSPEEAYVGKDLGSNEFTATDEILHHYYEGLEVDASFYYRSIALRQAGRPLDDSHQCRWRIQRCRL